MEPEIQDIKKDEEIAPQHSEEENEENWED